MDLAYITATKIIEMFIILLIGAGAYKARIADEETGSRLTRVLLNIISPCVILLSYQIDYDKERLYGLAVTAILSFASFLIAIAVSGFAVPKDAGPDMAVERMSIVYSNCGFIGIPLIDGILGREGVFYMTAYLTVFNIFVWSHGIMLMSGKSESMKKTIRSLINPSNAAIILGIFLFLTGIRLPEIFTEPVALIAGMNTPAAMLISGINLAQSDFLGGLKNKRTYIISIAKLIVVPGLTLLLLLAAGAERSISITILTAAACPSGAMGTMFALQYKRNGQYASNLLTITTALSLITIPAIMAAAGGIL
ncbi:AEC family transporter [Clostridium boliviensis]|uniref:AEC family transporter n=1 Tax=Clostridium boliviensis TaxID=318465 RepID=A0ABU4GES7_9CLOT|nr:AEC family transporter [Clostridium boliviensis]MDW2796128.1 AEC family transporter [Clostridium boliviensis]